MRSHTPRPYTFHLKMSEDEWRVYQALSASLREQGQNMTWWVKNAMAQEMQKREGATHGRAV